MRVRPEGPQLISALIRKELGLDCSVLMVGRISEDGAKITACHMHCVISHCVISARVLPYSLQWYLQGANIAADIARGELSEATIGYNVLENAELLADLFETEHFYGACG